MAKVGVVYKTDGNIDIKPLPLYVKFKVLVSHTIDTSTFLSGDMSQMGFDKAEADIKKIDRYIEAINSYVTDDKFANEKELYVIYDIEDYELVRTAAGHPQFSLFSKQLLEFNSDLKTLEAYLNGVLLLRRIV